MLAGHSCPPTGSLRQLRAGVRRSGYSSRYVRKKNQSYVHVFLSLARLRGDEERDRAAEAAAEGDSV